VLIVDDYAAFRRQARELLEADGFDVVGEAVDGASALAAVARLRPGVVLLDVQLPGLDGFEVTERLVAAGDAPVVVLISGRDPVGYRARLGRSRARGFISKSELSGERLAALLE
jgi:DNA-binding NarL/FixJ family response regulator